MTDYYYKCLPQKTYQNGDYTLEAVQSKHVEKIRQWRNGQMDVLRQSKPISKKSQITYYENYVWPQLNSDAPTQILLAYKYKKKLIGYGGLVNITWIDNKAEVSFLLDTNRINDKALYRKEFSLFLDLIKQLASRDLGLYKLCAETYDIRPLHIEILEYNKFKLEHRLTENVVINGKYVDSLIHRFIY